MVQKKNYANYYTIDCIFEIIKDICVDSEHFIALGYRLNTLSFLSSICPEVWKCEHMHVYYVSNFSNPCWTQKEMQTYPENMNFPE